MRYRIIIEVDANHGLHRKDLNELAQEAMHVFVTAYTNPVYLSTEKIEVNKDVLRDLRIQSD